MPLTHSKQTTQKQSFNKLDFCLIDYINSIYSIYCYATFNQIFFRIYKNKLADKAEEANCIHY